MRPHLIATSALFARSGQRGQCEQRGHIGQTSRGKLLALLTRDGPQPVPNRHAAHERGAAMIAWEDRDAAGRIALLEHIASGQAAIRAHWTEIALGAFALACATRDWAALGHTILSWF
jgi:hypothetical protein